MYYISASITSENIGTVSNMKISVSLSEIARMMVHRCHPISAESKTITLYTKLLFLVLFSAQLQMEI
jgi:hypothetical protein